MLGMEKYISSCLNLVQMPLLILPQDRMLGSQVPSYSELTKRVLRRNYQKVQVSFDRRILSIVYTV